MVKNAIDEESMMDFSKIADNSLMPLNVLDNQEELPKR